MTKKARITPALIIKAGKAFGEVKTGTIKTGEGLSRGELRALERAGYVRKSSIFTKGRFVGGGSTQKYRWQLEPNLLRQK